MARAPDVVPTDAPTDARKEVPCPICGRPSIVAAAPFCSKRCGDVDLHRWLGGVYAVPADDPIDAEGDGEGEA